MFTRSIRISVITFSLFCLFGLNAIAEDFSNTVKNVKVTSAGDGGVVVDVYIDSTDANVKPQLSTRKYKDDKYIIDLMQVTQKGAVSKDTSGASGMLSSKNINVGKLPGGTARILLNLDDPAVKVKDVRYHLINNKPQAPKAKEEKETNTNVLVKAESVKKPETKSVDEKTPVKEEKKPNVADVKKETVKPEVVSKPKQEKAEVKKESKPTEKPKIESKQEVKKEAPEVVEGPQIVHKTDKPIQKVDVKKETKVKAAKPDKVKEDIKPVELAKKEVKTKPEQKTEPKVEPKHEVKKEEAKPVISHKVETEHILDDVPEVVLVQTESETHDVEAENIDENVSEQTPLNFDDPLDEENVKIVDVKGNDIDFTGMLLTLIGALVIVVPLIFVAIWLINLFYKGGDSMGLKNISSMGGGNKFKILSSTSLGQGKSIHLVEIRGRQLVVGCTNNSINILTEFGDFDEFVDEQRGVENTNGAVSMNQNSSSKRFKKGRAPLGSFSDLYKDYTKKIDENDLEDEY